MDKNQILFTEIERRIKDITEEMDFYYKKIDKLDTVCEELERLLSFAEADDDHIEKLEFDEVFEEDDEELNELKKDYSEVCGSFDEFKKQFDSMINREETVCERCGEKVVKESDGYYYCEVCDYENHPEEEDDFDEESESYDMICEKCCSDMFEEIDEDGDRYYECSNCGRIEYM